LTRTFLYVIYTPMRQLRQIAINENAGPDHREVLQVAARLSEQYGSGRNAVVQLVRQHPLYRKTLRELESAGAAAPADS
jgi:hypothetical protein